MQKNKKYICFYNINFGKKQFTQNLLGLQKLYNLNLAGIKNYKKPDLYTPFCNYPMFYNCLYSDFLEKIRHENGGIYYKSLLPAFDLAPLATLARMGNIICTSHNNFKFIDNNINLNLKNLDIKFNILKLKNKKEAEIYLDKVKDGKIFLLLGCGADLPFNPYYSRSDAINAIKEGRHILPYNISLFYKYQKKYYINAVNFNFFGEISQEKLFEYWSGASLQNTVYAFEKYRIIEFETTAKHDLKLLKKALLLNANEYFKFKEKQSSKTEIYSGREAYVCYLKLIDENINNSKNKISDIYILDYFKRIETSLLFLHELLLDINTINNEYNKEINDLANIITLREKVYVDLIKNKKMSYKHSFSFLPEKEFVGLKVFNQKEKQYLRQQVFLEMEKLDKLFKSFL